MILENSINGLAVHDDWVEFEDSVTTARINQPDGPLYLYMHPRWVTAGVVLSLADRHDLTIRSRRDIEDGMFFLMDSEML